MGGDVDRTSTTEAKESDAAEAKEPTALFSSYVRREAEIESWFLGRREDSGSFADTKSVRSSRRVIALQLTESIQWLIAGRTEAFSLRSETAKLSNISLHWQSPRRKYATKRSAHQRKPWHRNSVQKNSSENVDRVCSWNDVLVLLVPL